MSGRCRAMEIYFAVVCLENNAAPSCTSVDLLMSHSQHSLCRPSLSLHLTWHIEVW